jgi:tetrapyrrole methylase family protein/MazG family protein
VTKGITIIGLGPAGPQFWTQETVRVLQEASELYLRTERHPAVAAIPSHIARHSFDYLYEEASSFEEVYEAITDDLLRLGARAEGVIYAVPGHPMVGESTVLRLRQLAAERGLPLRILDSVSFIEPTLTALGLDALPGLQIVDAMELVTRCYPPLNPDLPALLAQLHGRRLASQVKLILMTAYADDHPVTLVQAAGSDRQRTWELPLCELDRAEMLDHLTALYIPPWAQPGGLESFQDTVARLRAPDGCPWDRAQTHQTLRRHLLEETYEVLAALDEEDMAALCQELGDLLLQIVLHVQIASEGGEFRMADVIAAVDAKIHRRHPHVFAREKVDGVDEVLQTWEAIKEAERGEKEGGGTNSSVLDGLPAALPALAMAQAISERVVRVGFDWPDVGGVLNKINEEVKELAAARDEEERAAELGDLLFSLVNLARWLDLDAESALRRANNRFARRFRAAERLARQRNVAMAELDIEGLDELWEQAKQMEETGNDD